MPAMLQASIKAALDPDSPLCHPITWDGNCALGSVCRFSSVVSASVSASATRCSASCTSGVNSCAIATCALATTGSADGAALLLLPPSCGAGLPASAAPAAAAGTPLRPCHRTAAACSVV